MAAAATASTIRPHEAIRRKWAWETRRRIFVPTNTPGAMTGTIETTMFGSVARGDLELTKM